MNTFFVVFVGFHGKVRMSFFVVLQATSISLILPLKIQCFFSFVSRNIFVSLMIIFHGVFIKLKGKK